MKYKEVLDFSKKHSCSEKEILSEIRRDTWVNVLFPQMLTDELQGQFMEQLSIIKKPKTILEIGTFTGYSAICMAYGLAKKGKIHSIEINPELENRIKNNFKKAGVENQIDLYIGNALDIIPSLNMSFDMIYIDADKSQYSKYFTMVYPLLNPSGILLIDNVFWGGKMLKPDSPKSKGSQGIHKFLIAASSKKWSSRIILPFGDGLWMGTK